MGRFLGGSVGGFEAAGSAIAGFSGASAGDFLLQFGGIDDGIGAQAEGPGIHLPQPLGEDRGEGPQENVARAGIFLHEMNQVVVGDAPKLAELDRRDGGGGRARIEEA